MKILIDNLNEFYSEKVRLVKTLMKRESPREFPELLKWKLQMLYFDGNDWVEICRIDNYLHEGQHGSHVHVFGRQDVRWTDMKYQDACISIKRISSKILREEFKENVEFDQGDPK